MGLTYHGTSTDTTRAVSISAAAVGASLKAGAGAGATGCSAGNGSRLARTGWGITVGNRLDGLLRVGAGASV